MVATGCQACQQTKSVCRMCKKEKGTQVLRRSQQPFPQKEKVKAPSFTDPQQVLPGPHNQQDFPQDRILAAFKTTFATFRSTTPRVDRPENYEVGVAFFFPHQSLEKWLTNAPVLTMHKDLSSSTEALTVSRVSAAPAALGAHRPAQPARVHTHGSDLWTSRDTQLLCRHLSAPPTHNHTETRETEPVLWGEYTAKDLAMNSQIPQHGWKGCTEISLTRLPALTGTTWQPGTAGGNLRRPYYCIS